MNFLANDAQDLLLVQPFCMPQSHVVRDSAIVVGTITIPDGWRAQVGLLSLHFIGLSNLEVPSKKSSGLHMAFAGIYEGIQGVNNHTGRPLVYAGTDVPSCVDSNPFGHHDLIAPGHYTILAVNNTVNVDLQLAVSASLRLRRL